MSYITDDPRVKDILKGAPSKQAARQRIRDLPPQEGSDIRYLEWEIEAALEPDDKRTRHRCST